MEVVFRGKTTNAEVRERKRKEKQDELGVCRIRRTKRDQRSQTLGSGFVVKDLEIIPGFCCPYCLISSDRVFPKDDCNIESYYLDFRKLESTDLKTVKLVDVAAKSTDITRTSGLVVIPIKPSTKCDKNQSIFTYRPFKVASVGITPDEDLVCHFVDDGPGQTNFSVKGLALKRSETVPTQFQLHEALDRPYTTYDEVTRKGDRKPYGAVILKRSNNEFMAGGALTFTDNECRNISSVFFPLPLVTQTSEPVPDGNENPVSEQQVSVDNAPAPSIEVESPGVASAALKLRTDVDTMKPAECNTQDRTPVSAIESEGSKNGQHRGSSTVPVSSGQTQSSCAWAEAPQAPNPIPTEREVLRLIAANYLRARPFICKDDCDDFLTYMEKMQVIIAGVSLGSLLITVKCDSLQILERLWEDYSSGHLGEVIQRCFVTEEILTEFSLAELKLKTTISEVEYKACKAYFEKDPARDVCAVPVEKSTHFLDEKILAERDNEDDSLKETDETDDKDGSVSDDEDQCGRVAEPVEKPIHFTDEENLAQRGEEDDSRTEAAEKKLKTETDEGYSVSDDKDQLGSPAVRVSKQTHLVTEDFLTEGDDISDSGISSASSSLSLTDSDCSTREDPRIGILKGRVHQIAKAGLEMFDVSSPKGLQDYLTYLTDKMDSLGLLRTRGSVSDKPLSFWEHDASKEGGHNSTTPEEQPHTEEEKTRPEGGTTTDQHTASSMGSELQGDKKWARSVVMQKTSKPVQESRSVKYLTEAMDDEELRQFVAVHVKEGKWQVVMLFLDELLHRQGVSEVERNSRETDEDAEKIDLKSRTLTWWPTDEDHNLVMLYKVLIESDHEVNILNLSENNITDEEVKHLAQALLHSNCKVNSLDLSWSNLTDEGVKHIAEALLDSNCKLNSLNLSHSFKITDEGVRHIAKALKLCQLNSLNLSESNITDEGVQYLAAAVKEGNCKLDSLNLSDNNIITDEGVKRLAEALKHSNCKLKSLNLKWSNITDEGVKHLAEALEHSNCKLNSLNLEWSNITDEGVNCLAQALLHSNCELNSLNLSCCNITDEGVKHLSQALKLSNCKLNSLNLSDNCKITDKGVKHLAKELKHSNCKLNSLYISDNYRITDQGVKHLAEALLHSNCKLYS